LRTDWVIALIAFGSGFLGAWDGFENMDLIPRTVGSIVLATLVALFAYFVAKWMLKYNQ
jgi:divalent metal cation (Fe/Co/Zn/Cd) transporter